MSNTFLKAKTKDWKVITMNHQAVRSRRLNRVELSIWKSKRQELQEVKLRMRL